MKLMPKNKAKVTALNQQPAAKKPLVKKLVNVDGSIHKDGDIIQPYMANRNTKIPDSAPTNTVNATKNTVNFPESAHNLAVVKNNIGGSNGASIVQDNSGNKFVRKTAPALNPQKKGQLKEEALADSIYDLMGVDVPKTKNYNNGDGSISKLGEYIEGKDLGELSQSEIAGRPEITNNIQKGFAVDALLANWDSIGLVRDNIKVTADDRTYRIDNGGSMRYRAMGGDKGKAFSDDAGELWSLRKIDNLQGLHGGASSNSQDFFGSMSYGQVMGQVGDVLKQRQNLLRHLIQRGADSGLISKLSKRLDAFQSYHDKYTKDKASGASDAEIDKDTENMVMNNRHKHG